MSLLPTASQTVGPYVAIVLASGERREIVEPSNPAALRLRGHLYDGAGAGVPDGLVELWYGPEDPGPGANGSPPTWPAGFGRCLTGPDGGFSFVLTKPHAGSDAGAPHVEVLVFARGLLRSLRSRMYFPDEAGRNATDPVLGAVGEERRDTLVARSEGGELRFDIRLQGEHETVFFG
ncbi:MAG TPA: protocatechuate 3,4-dioxygenase subunit alpha [Acidimicrobiales bacterium]|nr:protocatechuate 3,4-dioxygenase subunit alpha [Acidimicrobiales bacterium]